MKPLVLVTLVLSACATEAPIDPATCDARSYRIDTVALPTNNVAAREFGLDLDGDQMVDNHLGQVAATLSGMFGDPLDLDATAAAHLATDTDWRITTWHCAGTARLGAITQGDEALVPTLEGEEAGTIQLAGTADAVPLTVLFDGAGTVAPAFMAAESARLEMTGDEDRLEAKLAVALEGTRQRELVIRAMAPFLNLHLDDDGFGRLDTNHDGVLTEAELAANSLVQALLDPELEVGGVDAISLGVRVRATRVK